MFAKLTVNPTGKPVFIAAAFSAARQDVQSVAAVAREDLAYSAASVLVHSAKDLVMPESNVAIPQIDLLKGGETCGVPVWHFYVQL